MNLPPNHPANNPGVIAALDRLGRALYDYAPTCEGFDPEIHSGVLEPPSEDKAVTGAVMYIGSMSLGDLVKMMGAPTAVTLIDGLRTEVEQQTAQNKATAST